MSCSLPNTNILIVLHQRLPWQHVIGNFISQIYLLMFTRTYIIKWKNLSVAAGERSEPASTCVANKLQLGSGGAAPRGSRGAAHVVVKGQSRFRGLGAEPSEDCLKEMISYHNY